MAQSADARDEGFGARLRSLREEAGLSLGELSSLTHYSTSYLSRIETGHRPALPGLAALCDEVLGADGTLAELVQPPDRTGGQRRPGAPPRGAGSGPGRAPGAAPGATDGTAEGSTDGEPEDDRVFDDRPDQVTDLFAPSKRRGSYAPPLRSPGYSAEFGRLIRLGDAHHTSGRMREAAHWYQQAYHHAQGWPRPQAEAVIRLARRWSDPGQTDRDVVELLRASLRALAADQSPEAERLRLRLDAHLSKKMSLAVSEDTAVTGIGPSEGADLARRTLRRIPRDCPDDVRCEVLTECRWGLYDHLPAAELLQLAESLQDSAARVGSAHFDGEALVALALDQFRVGHITRATATVELHRRHAARTRSALTRWYQCTFDTMLDLWNGKFATAAEWVFGESRQVIASLEADLEIPADTLRQTRMGQEYWLLHEQGQMAQMLGSELADGVERRTYFPVWRAGMTLALCEIGLYDQAADHLTAFAEDTDDFRTLAQHGWAVPTLTILAEACELLAAQPEHRTEITRLIPLLAQPLSRHHTEIALAGWPTVLVGPASRASGLLALAAHDGPKATEHFRTAERLARTSPPLMARLRADQARALLLPNPDTGAGPSTEEAAHLLASSLKRAETLGMARLAEQVRELQSGLPKEK